MTEAWRSNPMHFCELCRVWMQDTKAARANHERGAKHQEHLARKLRDMSRRADADKAEAAATAKGLAAVEAAAAAAYARDEAAAAAASAAAAGSWEWDEASGYYYNAQYRWYWDAKTGWYYGGEPTVEWTEMPPPSSLPAGARFGAAPHSGGPLAGHDGAAAAAQLAGASAGARDAGTASTSAAAVARAGVAVTPGVKRVVELPKHPLQLQQIGGHQMHQVGGRIGGAKGVGAAPDGGGGGEKRKREAGDAAAAAAAKKKAAAAPANPAEAEALARREAARARVQARTMSTFGLT